MCTRVLNKVLFDPNCESMSYLAPSGTSLRSSLVQRGLWWGIVSREGTLGLWCGLFAFIELGFAVPFASIDPGCGLRKRLVFDANEIPTGYFCWSVNDEMYSVGGSDAHSLGVMLQGTLLVFIVCFDGNSKRLLARLISTFYENIIITNFWWTIDK